MIKWADYLISAVHYDWTHSRIEQVRVHPDDEGDSIKNYSIWNRAQVVGAINSGHTFVTIFMSNGMWRKGEDVRVLYIEGQPYIRTDRNNRATDNLENLPEF